LKTLLLLLALQAAPPDHLAPPVRIGKWIVPAQKTDARPVWGIKGGVSVGLWPQGGPRGLLRVYTPYLGQRRYRVMNFIAVEPVVGRARGLSELEPSGLDRVRGKRMWTSNDLENDPGPALPWRPARGKFIDVGKGKKALTFFLVVERFRNGARPVIQVLLREDLPHEVGFRIFSARGGKRMKSCILTATMGNWARLRNLWLKNDVFESTHLWAGQDLNRFGFMDSRAWPLKKLLRIKDEVIVACTPDEADPARAGYSKSVPSWWRYRGRVATQYWRKRKPHKGLVVRVNGRNTYWGTKAPIPGGVAFENFEFEEPFSPGQEFWFGVTPRSPDSLGFKPVRQ